MDVTEIEEVYRRVQDRFVAAIEELDGTGTFGSDDWARPGGGGGVTRILEGGGRIERAAVNFSAVHGPAPRELSEAMTRGASTFYATGVSIIVHPLNPHAPTFHANLRYLETGSGPAWFGGGADLTPHYLYEEDARHFHSVLRRVCDAHPVGDYPAWKEECDRYFQLPHRGEARGVGGIFFDHLTEPLPSLLALQADLGLALPEAYLPILERRVDIPYGDAERRWQEIRRGRYVEFNLVWDRGTRFGLETSGRVESILASLPPRARWHYDHQPASGTPESELYDLIRGEPRNWA